MGWATQTRAFGFRLDGQPAELHRRIGQGLGSAGGDALAQGDDLGERLLALPPGVGPLDRGTPSGPGAIKALEVEQALGELVFEGDEAFGGGGQGAIIARNLARSVPK